MRGCARVKRSVGKGVALLVAMVTGIMRAAGWPLGRVPGTRGLRDNQHMRSVAHSVGFFSLGGGEERERGKTENLPFIVWVRGERKKDGHISLIATDLCGPPF